MNTNFKTLVPSGNLEINYVSFLFSLHQRKPEKLIKSTKPNNTQ